VHAARLGAGQRAGERPAGGRCARRIPKPVRNALISIGSACSCTAFVTSRHSSGAPWRTVGRSPTRPAPRSRATAPLSRAACSAAARPDHVPLAIVNAAFAAPAPLAAPTIRSRESVSPAAHRPGTPVQHVSSAGRRPPVPRTVPSCT
jgi:hypothetical protein